MKFKPDLDVYSGFFFSLAYNNRRHLCGQGDPMNLDFFVPAQNCVAESSSVQSYWAPVCSETVRAVLVFSYSFPAQNILGGNVRHAERAKNAARRPKGPSGVGAGSRGGWWRVRHASRPTAVSGRRLDRRRVRAGSDMS